LVTQHYEKGGSPSTDGLCLYFLMGGTRPSLITFLGQ
jgi:hypothetical protein